MRGLVSDQNAENRMRAVQVRRLGEPASIHIADTERCRPGAHQVRIAVEAAGVAFVDALLVRGGYQGTLDLPYIPGTECSGTIEAIGSEIRHVSPGDRVFAVTPAGGSFANFVIADGHAVVPVVKAVAWEELAVVGGSYLTAYHALVHRARAREGEIMVVRGAAGALGIAAIEIGLALGIEVVALASTPAKRELALSAGACGAVDSGSPEWRNEVAALLNGRTPDIIFDPVGGEGAPDVFRMLGWGGRHLVLGFAAGAIPKLPFNLCLLKGASLIGVNAAAFLDQDPSAAQHSLRAVADMLEAGKIAPRVAECRAFEDFATALAHAASGDSVGRIVLRVPAPSPVNQGNRR